MQIKYDIAEVEKRLLTLINVMVSHELRNPLNSIKNQNFRQKCINEKLNELIYDKRIRTGR